MSDNARFHAIQDELFWFHKLLESIPEVRPGNRLLRFVELVELMKGTRLILAERGMGVTEAMILEALVTRSSSTA